MAQNFLTDPCGIPYINGANVGWNNFGTDFGGITADFGGGGPFTIPPLHDSPTAQQEWTSILCDLAAHKITVARYWIFPEIWTTDINFAGNGTQALSTNGALDDDICKLLELADGCGIQLQPTIISFDAFKRRGNAACVDDRINGVPGTPGSAPDSYVNVYDIWTAGHWPDFCQNVIGPMVAAAENCPFSSALHSWDIMNEPDQVTLQSAAHPLSAYIANAGTGILTSNQDFDGATSNGNPHDPACYNGLNIVEMRQFLKCILDEVKDHSTCPATIGVNTKWNYAFAPNASSLPGDVNLNHDFVSLHTYHWQEPIFPTYTVAPSYNHSSGLPTMMGEYPPANGVNGVFPSIGNHADEMEGWCTNGYFGHMSWRYGEAIFGFGELAMDEHLAFAEDFVCEPGALVVDQSDIPCDQVSTLTAQIQNKCGRPYTEEVLTISPGTWNYDPATCRYVSSYTPVGCDAVNTFTSGTLTDSVNVGSDIVSNCTEGQLLTTVVGSNKIRGSVLISCGSICSCKPTVPQLITNQWECLPMGGSWIWQVQGCDCGCDGDGKQCGPLQAYWKNKPPWIKPEHVCFENGVLTIIKKGRAKPNVGFFCGVCPEEDCVC